MKHVYYTQGVCSKKMTLELDKGLIKSLAIEGGCNGNLKGLSALVLNQPITEVVARLSGITCGVRGTSCPDQLAKALQEALALEEKERQISFA